nr:uncharacterized protein LOC109746932 [Aegilops tauschii subsp. strangulata]
MEKADWFPEADEKCFPGDYGINDEEDEPEGGNKFGTYTIMSDRQKGLLKAINEVFPDSPQRYCLRHIHANFQSAGFRGQELKKCIDKASYSYIKHGHELGMAELKAQSEDAWKRLKKIEVSTWARFAMDHTCKTDLVVNNLSEVFNKMILDVRAKPIRTMFEGIRTKQMIQRQQTREKLQISRWTITPTYSEILEENKQYAKYCQADRAGPTIWQVTSKEKQYCVDMEGYTCDCKRWNMTGVPCSHGISVLTKQKLHPEDYVNDFFKKPLYLEIYKEIIYPVPGPDFRPHTNTPDIEPPVFKEKAGRKQTARRTGEFKVPAPRDTSRMGTITCGNYGLEGHKAVYAPPPSAPVQTPRAPAPSARAPAPAASTPAPHARAPAPAASAPAPTTTAKRGRPAGGGRRKGFSAPRSVAATSDVLAGNKRKSLQAAD